MIRLIQRYLLPFLPEWFAARARTIVPASIRASYRRASNDVFLLSFPCAGRTWVRLLIFRTLQHHFGIERAAGLNIQPLIDESGDLSAPRIIVEHDGNPHERTPSDLLSDKNYYRGAKVILLVREPRDQIVSWYFEATRRQKIAGNESLNFNGEISEFIRGKRGGLETLLEYYNIWADNMAVPDDVLIVRYEDLRRDPLPQLRAIVEFIGFGSIDDKILSEAIEFCSMENMRRLESSGRLDDAAFQPGDRDDRESFKVRRGVVGGFRDYLSESDQEYVEKMIGEKLRASFLSNSSDAR